MKLFLDDERFPPGNESDWVIVRSYNEAVTWVKDHVFPDFVSFDNDLGRDSFEGWRFAQWLIDYDIDTGLMPNNFNFTVHSQNPVRRVDIEDRLNSYLDYKKKVFNRGSYFPSSMYR